MENNSVIATLRLGYRSGLEPLVLAFAGLSLSFAITAIRGRRFPWAIFLLAILLSGLAWFAIRNVPLMALLSLSAISINIGLSGLRQDLLTGKTAILALGLVILAGVLYNAGTLVAKAPILGLGLLPGAGIPSEFLRDSHLEGPILNNFDTGGYLIQYAYPEYPVFIDSRPEAYPAAFIVEKYLKPLQNETLWKQLLEEYRFNIIFFSVLAPSDFQFVLRRAADPAWAPVFYDGDIFILVRRTAANLKFVQKYEIPKELLETAKIAM
jgi:hypothetical protein